MSERIELCTTEGGAAGSTSVAEGRMVGVTGPGEEGGRRGVEAARGTGRAGGWGRRGTGRFEEPAAC